ncbi:MAG: hypothetical protein ACX931_07640 [Saccharospirillum sp.]
MQRLQAGKAARVGNLMLIPLFRVQAEGLAQPDFLWLNAIAEPFAVVIIEPGHVRALGVDAQELDLARLCAHIPGLSPTIDAGIASLA